MSPFGLSLDAFRLALSMKVQRESPMIIFSDGVDQAEVVNNRNKIKNFAILFFFER
jgi:hypothetical protein